MSDCESPSAFSQTTRRARKAHDCCEFPATIQPGETYQYISGVWDGRGDSFKTCMLCASARAFFERELTHQSGYFIPLGHLIGFLGEVSFAGVNGFATDDASAAIVGRALGLLYARELRSDDIRQVQLRARRHGRLITMMQAAREAGL
jgi:hypothetical protein